MPRRDGTGPLGQGAMTGRQLGTCAQNPAQEPDKTDPPISGMGMAFGRGGRAARGQAKTD